LKIYLFNNECPYTKGLDIGYWYFLKSWFGKAVSCGLYLIEYIQGTDRATLKVNKH
jgi:hypothetical protein